MHRLSPILGLGSFLALLAVGLSAQAATIVPLSERGLVAKADTIAVGTVLRTRTAKNAQGWVVTHADVQIYRPIAGADALDIITLEVPGGVLPGGIMAHVAGSPRLEAGQLVLGFLERHGSVLRPLGLSFGLLRVRQASDGSYRVYRDLEGLHLSTPTGDELDPKPYALADEPLEAFIARIEGHLREVGGTRPTRPGEVRP